MSKKRKVLVSVLIIIVVLTMLLIKVIQYTGIFGLWSISYTKTQIINHLEKKYDEKFIIKEEVENIEDNKDKFYIVYPVSDKTLEFFVQDEAPSYSIGLGGGSVSYREIHDTYTNSLLKKDLINLEKIYPKIYLEEYKNTDYNSIWFGSSYQTIELYFSNTYQEIDNFVYEIVEMYNYIQKNLNKYKITDNNTIIKIEAPGIALKVDNDTPRFTEIKENILNYLLYNFRENNNPEIYNIPADIKEKYEVKDIGWGNFITKIYINDNLFALEHFKNVKIVYKDEMASIDVSEIFELILDLKNNLDLVEYNNLKNIDKIEGEIMLAYTKDNNIYILAEDDRGYVNIYEYLEGNIDLQEWDYKDGLNKYFGVTISYDFEKEILHINY